MENEKTVIEINGVKLEVDLRCARKITEFRVGDSVKLLLKKYSDSYESHIGMIVDFDAFTERPTIVIAYIDASQWDSSNSVLKFAYLNKDSKDVEVAAVTDDFRISIEKNQILAAFDGKIKVKENEIEDLKRRKRYFIEKFQHAFRFVDESGDNAVN